MQNTTVIANGLSNQEDCIGIMMDCNWSVSKSNDKILSIFESGNEPCGYGTFEKTYLIEFKDGVVDIVIVRESRNFGDVLYATVNHKVSVPANTFRIEKDDETGDVFIRYMSEKIKIQPIF